MHGEAEDDSGVEEVGRQACQVGLHTAQGQHAAFLAAFRILKFVVGETVYFVPLSLPITI